MSQGIKERERRRFRLGTVCPPEEDRTRQEDAAAADINAILARMGQGQLPLTLAEKQGIFADVSGMGDFRESVERVRVGGERFAQLSADVRSAFENDSALFVEAFQTPEGLERLRELGVVAPSEEALADRREAAAEERARLRAAVRAENARVEAARKPPS